MFISSSQTSFDHALSELDKLLEDPQFSSTKDKVKKYMAHGVNGGRALQDVFTADSIASSRIESRNAALKWFGVGSSLSLLGCLLSLKDMVKSQEYNCIADQDKEYKFVSDGAFISLHEKDALIGVTCEVLEKMYVEYNLGCGGKYKVTKGASCEECNEYIVTYNDDKNTHDLHMVRCDTNGNLSCWCCIRSGYPCRHVFAVVEQFHLKITLGSTNTRFYIDQSGVDFTKINMEALGIVLKSMEHKQAKYGTYLKGVTIRDISVNASQGIDVIKAFQEDLKKNGHTLGGCGRPVKSFGFTQPAQLISDELTTPELKPNEDSEGTELLAYEDDICSEEPESVPEEVSPPPVLPSAPMPPEVEESTEMQKMSDSDLYKYAKQHFHSAFKLMSREEKEKLITSFLEIQARVEKKPGRKESKRHKDPSEPHKKKRATDASK